MKTKLTNRLLMTMVIAVALSVLFAVSSLAAITGGYGVIEGLEEDQNYEAASVTINAEGTGKAIDEANAFDLDANSNKDLAGLYVVREKGETTWSDIIYVYGKYEARSAMHELYNTGKVTNALKVVTSANNSFVSGTITSTKGLYNKTVVSMDIPGKAYGLTVESHFGWSTLKDFYNATTPDEKLAGFNKVKDVAKSIVYRYALTNEEIVPISEANKYTFGFNNGSNYGGINGFTYTNNTVRFEAYVMDNSGSISTYTYDFAGIKFAINNPSELAVDFTEDTGWSSALPDEGYLVGFAMYPYHGFDNPDNLTVTINTSKNYTGDTARTIFYYYYNDYSVDFPKAKAPTGITFEDGKFKGLDASKTYFIAPCTILGADTDKAIPVSGATEYELTSTQTGLWGIFFAGIDGYVTASDAGALAYTYGSATARKDLMEVKTLGTTTTYQQVAISAGDKFQLGYVTGTGTWGNYSGWTAPATYAIGTTGTHFSGTLNNNFHNAADDTAKKTAFDALVNAVKNVWVGYAYTEEEIIPVSDVNTYQFQLKISQGVSSNDNHKVKYDAYVIDNSGELKVYSYITEGKTLNANLATWTVDFTTDEGWETLLPDDGYLVGFKVWPYYGLLDYTKFKTSVYAHGSRVEFRHVPAGYSIDIPTHETPTGITFVDGTFKGLDASLTYALTPYTIAGVDETKAITFTGKTEYALDPEKQVGLWSINVAGDEYYQASKPAVFDSEGTILVYNYPTIAVRSDMHERTTTVSGDKEVTKIDMVNSYTRELISGLFTHNSWIGEPKANSFATDQIFSVAFLEALIAAGDDKNARQAAVDNFDATLKGYQFSYGLVSEEIVPISDVVTYEYQIKGTTIYSVFNLKIENNTMRFDAYVMDTDGTISSYTYLDTNKKYDSAGVFTTSTVDFTDSSKWTPALPDKGYFVGFAAYPFYGMDDEANYKFSFNGTNTTLIPPKYPNAKDKARCEFHFKSYTISVPKYDKPTGLTIDENGVVSGLDPNILYGVATYNIYGMDYDNMSAIWDGEYTFDLETQKGLWAIIVPGDDYMGDSDPFLVYNKSPDRKDIGKKPEGKEYLDYVNLGGKAAPADGIWAEEKLSFYRIYTPTYTSEYSQYLCGDLYGGNMEVDLEKAIAENDTDKISSIRDTKIAGYQASSFMHYIYAADEIIPIQDLFELKFGIKYQNGQSKFTATHHVKLYVMDVDGKVSEYLYVGPTYDFSTNTSNMHTVTVDVQSIEGLPTEGWVVGFRYEPFGEIDKDTLVPKSSPAVNGAHGLYFYFYTPDYKIKEDAPKPDIKSFPVIAGGYGEISGLNPDLLHQYIYSADQGATWTKWEDGEVPADVTAFKVTEGGLYRVRVKDTDDYYGSDYDEEEVGVYTEADGEVLASEVVKMHLPNDFVELSAEYEMDLTVKNWVSALALENIKAVAPDSVITLAGDGYKFVVTASKIATDKKVHYYNMAVSLDGESRYNTLHDKFVEMAGKEYVTDVYFESSSKLPFEEAQVMIELGAANDGADVELRSYNERIDKLRKVEEGTVYDGWVTFNNFEETYVIIKK